MTEVGTVVLHEKNLIGGEWTDGSSKNRLEVINPATGEVFATVPKAAKEDADAAVDAADRAFPAWAAYPPSKGARYLRSAAKIVLERCEEIGRLMTLEQGKPLAEAMGEVRKGAEILRYYAEEGERIYGRIIPNAEPFTESRVIYQPIGVAAAISPWNYPIELPGLEARRRSCLRMYGRMQAPFRDAGFADRIYKMPAGCRIAPGCSERADRARFGTRPGPDKKPEGQKSGIHRLHGGRETGACRFGRHAEKSLAGIRRKPADDGLQRLRYRCGCCGRGPALFSQYGADLHRRQQDLRGQGDLRSLPGKVRRSGKKAENRQRA